MKALGWAIIAITGAILATIWTIQISVPAGAPPRYLVPALLAVSAVGVVLTRMG